LNETIPTATLKPKEERRLLRGHLWAFRNEFKQLPTLSDGELVDIFTEHRRFVGRGFYQAEGGIAVRLLSRHAQTMNSDFWNTRLQTALKLRQQLFQDSQAYRWIHGESDGLPGLVVDRYGAVISVQTQCAFYTLHADTLASSLMHMDTGISGVIFQGPTGAKEWGTIPHPHQINLDGIEIQCNIKGGQKTGMFLDQRVNCQLIKNFASGKRILDGHCYLGMWGLHAAKSGAKSVLGVDSSARAIEMATENARLNAVTDTCTYACADVETLLESEDAYDIVVIDPPAFAKSRGQVKKALVRYQQLNRLALAKIPTGGMLFTSSCSHFVDTAQFLEMIKRSAVAVQRQVQLLTILGASPDHPALLSMPETAYLKCAVFRLTE
jgi:23S rRNA (cytosine1962-C5)-methyltransferase